MSDKKNFMRISQKSHEIIRPETNTLDNKSNLYLATERGDISEVERCIKEGDDINQVSINNWSPLYLASCFGFLNIVILLVENGSELNFKNGKHEHTALIGCCQNITPSQNKIITYLVNQGANINLVENELYQSALYYTCENNNIDMVIFLITNGSNPNTFGKYNISPLFIACQEGHMRIVRYLVEDAFPKAIIDTELTSNGMTSLLIACYRNHWDIVKYLVTKSANINKKCDHSAYISTPLHAAVVYGNEEVTQMLIENGADVNALGPNNIGITPVYAAFDRKNWRIAKMLLDTGNVNVNLGESKTNSSLLHHVVRSENLEMIKYLLKFYADVNHTDIQKMSTPLHDAASAGNLEIIKLLVENSDGVDILQENVQSQSALDIAKAMGHMKIYDYLCRKVCETV